MSIEAIAAIGAAEPTALLPPTVAVAQPTGFSAWFAQEVSAVNTSLVNVENDVKKLAAGEVQSLHDVMIHMEEAKLSFQLLAQVRNRLLDAYQEVMRMSV